MEGSAARICALVVLLAALGLVWSTSAGAAAKRTARSAAGKSSAQGKSSMWAAGSKASKKTTRKASLRRRGYRQESFRSRLARQRLQPERVEEIQRALLQAGYLNQEPSGQWDTSTREAMRSFQHANGFPETGLPEAKSLMKLGLGPHPLPEELDPNAQASATSQSLPAGPTPEN